MGMKRRTFMGRLEGYCVRASVLHSDNLQAALALAIEVRAEHEKKVGYLGDSAMLTAWRDAMQDLREGRLPTLEARFS